MKCFISGLSGYIGTSLAQTLSQDRWEVIGLVRQENLRVPLDKKVKLQRIPASDIALQDLFLQEKPDVVFHLAGDYSAEKNDVEWQKSLEANFSLGYRLASANHALPDCRFINVSSYWEFAADENRGNSRYAALKSAFRHFLFALPPHLEIPFMSVVLYDVYGPNDWRPKLIPALLQSIGQEKVMPMTDGQQELDMIFIKDVCSGLKSAATTGFLSRSTCALSSGGSMKLRDIVSLAEKVWRTKLPVEWGAREYPPGQISRPTRKIPTLQDWQPQVSLSEGLQQCKSH
jgi:nucleoside-diphosphate-sugar epimerase